MPTKDSDKPENHVFSKEFPLFQDICLRFSCETFVKVIQISSLHINQRYFLHSCLAVQNRGTEPKSNLLEPQFETRCGVEERKLIVKIDGKPFMLVVGAVGNPFNDVVVCPLQKGLENQATTRYVCCIWG